MLEGPGTEVGDATTEGSLQRPNGSLLRAQPEAMTNLQEPLGSASLFHQFPSESVVFNDGFMLQETVLNTFFLRLLPCVRTQFWRVLGRTDYDG